MMVLPDAEDSIIVSSFVWSVHDGQTERQTDGQTDMVLLQWSALRALWTRCNKPRLTDVCS